MAVTVTEIGGGGLGVNGTSLPITTTANCPAGSVIFAICAVPSSGVSTVTDDDAQGSNTYTSIGVLSESPATDRLWGFYAQLDDNLPAGSIVTLAHTNSGKPVMKLFCIEGLDVTTPYDTKTAAGNSASSSTAPEADPVTPSNAASLVFGIVNVNNGYGFTFTQPTGSWTAFTKAGFGNGEDGIFGGWQEVASASPITYGPATIGTAGTWLAAAYVFKVGAGAPPAGGKTFRRALMGAG